MSNCSNCATLQQQIASLQGNLGMRTYGRMVATVEHLSHVADILGIVAGPPKAGVTWRSFRRFS